MTKTLSRSESSSNLDGTICDNCKLLEAVKYCHKELRLRCCRGSNLPLYIPFIDIIQYLCTSLPTLYWYNLVFTYLFTYPLLIELIIYIPLYIPFIDIIQYLHTSLHTLYWYHSVFTYLFTYLLLIELSIYIPLYNSVLIYLFTYHLLI